MNTFGLVQQMTLLFISSSVISMDPLVSEMMVFDLSTAHLPWPSLPGPSVVSRWHLQSAAESHLGLWSCRASLHTLGAL
jgi:hypothetical protein